MGLVTSRISLPTPEKLRRIKFHTSHALKGAYKTKIHQTNTAEEPVFKKPHKAILEISQSPTVTLDINVKIPKFKNVKPPPAVKSKLIQPESAPEVIVPSEATTFTVNPNLFKNAFDPSNSKYFYKGVQDDEYILSNKFFSYNILSIIVLILIIILVLYIVSL